MFCMALAYSQVIIALILALVTILVATGRKSPVLRIYASSFNLLALGFLLFLLQERASPWITIVLANCLLGLSQLFLAWGLRLFDGHPKSWPARFWLYFGIYCLLLVCFTFPFASAHVRNSIISFFIILATAEWLWPLFTGIRWLPLRGRYMVLGITLGIILFQCLRCVAIIRNLYPEQLLLEDNLLTIVSITLSITVSMLRMLSIFLLDTAQLLYEMGLKNSLLESIAMKDDLTGLLNRHNLEQTLGHEMMRQDRYGEPLALVMLDIDHFKHINDRFGHDIGDRVLVEIARRVSLAIRQTDFLFRWGGEEFFVLLPHTDLAGASVQAEKLRLRISEYEIDPVGVVTASLGVAERKQGESREQSFRRVDQSMYRAKINGRNRVEIWTDAELPTAKMVRVEWQKAWECGVPEVDTEHREMIFLGNELLNLSISGVQVEQMHELLERLISSIAQHFGHEEEILAECGYADLSAHREIHAKLLSEAEMIRSHFISGHIDPSLLFHFLVNEIVFGHMLSADIKFFPCLAKNYHSSR